MSLSDIVVIIILGLCVVLAIRGMKRPSCHDCSRCHKECGGKHNGREFRKVTKNQGKTTD